MLLTMQAMWSEDWQLYHKVIFDGVNKVIIINPNEPLINVKENIYSAWKEWMRLRDHSKFLPALRVSGGDPIGEGAATGDVYFTLNGWKVLLLNNCDITGTLYSDDYPSPYIVDGGAKIVTNKVSAISQSLGFTGTVNVTVDPNITPQEMWDYLVADANTPGSIGERMSKLLTVAKFLGLK